MITVLLWVIGLPIVLALLAVFVLGLTAWEALALKLLWGWFLIPYGAPALPFAVFMGLVLIVGYLTPNKTNIASRFKAKDEEALKDMVGALLRPGLVMGFGWLIQRFFM